MKKILKRILALMLVVCSILSYTVPAANAAISDLITKTREYRFDQYSTYQGACESDTDTKPEDMYLAILGGDYLAASTGSKESLTERYNADTLKWTYEAASAGICGKTTELEHVPASDRVRFFGNYLRISWGEGEWMAFRIKTPAKTDEYKVSLKYGGDPGSCTAAVYVMKAEGLAATDRETVLTRQEKIHAAMDPDNRIGKADLYARSSGENTAYIGDYAFEASTEYIVVVENYQNAELPGNNYIYLKSLYITTGTASGEVIEGDPKVNSVPVLEDAVPATDGGYMGAVWEVDGRDYFFLPREGGKMSIYDLELFAAGEKFDPVMTVDTGLHYPTHATVTPDGQVIVGGGGKRMFIFNTETMTGRNTPDFSDTPGLEGSGDNQGSFYNANDGLIYFGTLYDGHMVRYNIENRTYEDLGDMVSAEIQRMVFPKLKDNQIDNNGAVRSVVCCNGFAYGLATSDKYSILVKYDLSQEKVVAAIDVSVAMGLTTSNCNMSLLGEKYIIVGTSGIAGMTLVDIQSFALVTIDDVVAKGLFASQSTYAKNAWEYGMNGHATEVVNGKQYFYIQDTGLYSYNVENGQMAFESSAGKPFKTGQKTTVTLDTDKDGVDELYLFTYANGGKPRLFNVSTKELLYLNGLDVDLTNAAGSPINIGTDYNGTLYIGAWNNWNCVAYDTGAEAVKYRYVTGGQTDSQTYFVDENGTMHLISGNYSACVVYEIDPENTTYTDKDGNPSNIISPLIFTMKNYDQKRIHTVAAGDGYIFAGTIPTSNRNGGGVGVFKYGSELGTEEFLHFKAEPTLTTNKDVTVNVDGTTKKTVTIGPENVVPEEFSELWNLAVNSIAYHDGLLYGSTTRAGGSGAGMVDGTSARIFVMDYKDSDGDGTNLEILATLDLREYLELVDADGDGVEDPIDYVGGISIDEKGRIWGIVSDVLFCATYNKTAKTFNVQQVQSLGIDEYQSSGGVGLYNRKVLFEPDTSSVYVSFYNYGLHQITISDWNADVGSIQVTADAQILSSNPETYALGENNNLYYAEGKHLYMKPVNVVESDWTEAEEVDALIKELKVDSKEDIATVKAAYNALTPRQKALVQENRALLEIEAQALELEIADAIENVTADSMNTLAELIYEYNELDPSQQRYVQNFPDLETAYDTSIDMVNNALAYGVRDQIDALPETVTLADEGAVQDARTAYDELDADLQAKVTNLAKLEAAEASIANLKQQAADVQAQIDALSVNTLDDEAAVVAARNAYDGLTDEQKALVDTAKLVDAEAQIILLKAANTVQEQINALPEKVVLSDEAAVVAAREAYTALTDEQKAQVDTAKLEAAEARIAVLKAAKTVQDQIDALPDVVTLDNEAAVKAARKAYDALSDEARAEVNDSKLIAAEAQLVELEKVAAVQTQIDALPDAVIINDINQVAAARAAYEALSEEMQAIVVVTKLDAAEAALAELQKNAVPTKQVYDFELYRNPDFYTDCTVYSYNGTDRIATDFEGHRNYDSNRTIAQWFYENYSETINWAMETTGGSNGTLKDFAFRGKSDQGMRLQTLKAGQYVSVRIFVPAAGLYTVDLKTGANGNTVDVYMFKADTYYPAAQTANAVIAEAMTPENQLVDNLTLKANVEANLGQWTFSEAGDYIVVFKVEADSTKGVEFRNMTLTPVLNEETAVAVVGDQYFLSLDQAFAYQAENGEKYVSLNKDLQVGDLHLETNQVLDLNGHTLTVDSIKSYASSGIIDNSEKDTGVLKILDPEGNMLSEDNSQLPVYDETAEGLRFFVISVKSVAITGKDSGNTKYWFKVSCENFEELYKLIQANNELMNITVRMTWDNGGSAEASADPIFLTKWAEKYAASGDNFYITVTAVNTEGFDNFSLIPCIEANNVARKGEEMN